MLWLLEERRAGGFAVVVWYRCSSDKGARKVPPDRQIAIDSTFRLWRGGDWCRAIVATTTAAISID